MKWKKPRGKELRWNKKILIRRDGLNCKICGEEMKAMHDVTLDHIEPLCRGGQGSLINLRLAHRRCNELRGCTPVEDMD